MRTLLLALFCLPTFAAEIRISEPNRLDDAIRFLKPGDTLVLAPSVTYQTAGPWAFPERNHIPIPADVTVNATGATIKLGPVAVARPDQPLMRFGPGARILGGIWNCAPVKGYGTGLRFWGTFRMEGSVIQGLSGSRREGVEAFAISSEGDTSGSLVKGIMVRSDTSDPDSYVSGIYIGATAPSTKQSVVEGCDVELGTNGWFAYSGTSNVKFIKCTGNASRFGYTDTGDGERLAFVDCTGNAPYAWLSFATIPGDKPVSRSVKITGCRGRAGRIVEWADYGGAMSGSVLVQNSDFEAEWISATLGTSGAVVFDGNRITGERKIAGKLQPTIYE